MQEVDVRAQGVPRLWMGLVGLAAAAVVSAVALAPSPLTLGTYRDVAPARAARSWREQVGLVDAALGRGDVSAAVRASHNAYGAAVSSRRWEALVEVGDAFLRVGAAAGSTRAARPSARQAYLAALRLAERERSAEGVRRVGAAFAALGDEEAAAYCARIVDALTARASR